MSDSVNDVVVSAQTRRNDKQIVFSLHGIRSPGTWQKDFARELTEHDFIYCAPDYGWFRGIQFLVPYFRRRKYRWFVTKYDENIRGSRRLPSIVAHSFGSLIVTEVMDQYPHVCFDRIILCGSIVRRNYDWSSKISRGQCNSIHNDYGGLDIWAWSARFFVSEAGDSGINGFIDEAVSQIFYPGYFHSDYFLRANYDRSWIPFLCGGKAHRLTDEDLKGEPNNRVFRLTMIILFLLTMMAIGFWIRSYLTPATIQVDNISFERLATDHRSDEFQSILDKYKAAHEGRQVTWDAIIQERLPNGYIISPVVPELSDFTVLATYDPSANLGWLKVGERVKIKATIDDINPSTIRLRLLELVAR